MNNKEIETVSKKKNNTKNRTDNLQYDKESNKNHVSEKVDFHKINDKLNTKRNDEQLKINKDEKILKEIRSRSKDIKVQGTIHVDQLNNNKSVKEKINSNESEPASNEIDANGKRYIKNLNLFNKKKNNKKNLYASLPNINFDTNSNSDDETEIKFTTSRSMNNKILAADGETHFEISKNKKLVKKEIEKEGSKKENETKKEGSAKDSETKKKGSAKDSKTKKEGSAKENETKKKGSAKFSETKKEGSAKENENVIPSKTKKKIKKDSTIIAELDILDLERFLHAQKSNYISTEIFQTALNILNTNLKRNPNTI